MTASRITKRIKRAWKGKAPKWKGAVQMPPLAQGMETGTAKTEGCGPKDDSPVPTECAKTEDPS